MILFAQLKASTMLCNRLPRMQRRLVAIQKSISNIYKDNKRKTSREKEASQAMAD